MKTTKELIACAKRELALRRNVYPKWVASGRMKAEQCEHEIACMEAIVVELETKATEPELFEPPESNYRKALRTGIKPDIWPPILMSQEDLDHFRKSMHP
jgi:hypothetical protein